MSVDVARELGIPHITVLETLGRGGFGVVYKAFDSKMNRQVAVKVLTSVVDQSDLERFEQECRLHGPLSSHRSIVTVYDAGYTGHGNPYLVMELIDGGTLTDQLTRSGPIHWQQAVEWMIPICDAVQAAHDRGVLHRDIKPSNILLSQEGPKLADFGIACLSDATSPHFAVSWLHAAPESHDNTRDTRSDVYSLASTLYELLAGKAPFWGEDQPLTKLMMRLIDEPPPHLPPPVGPWWLDDVLQRALSKNPAERPQTAADLAAALSEPRTASAAAVPGFASPVLAGASNVSTQALTQIDAAPASVRLDSGPVDLNSLPPMQMPGSQSVSGDYYGYGVQVVERPRRRRGALLAAAGTLVALSLAGLALSPAGADILDRIASPTTTIQTPTTTDPTGSSSPTYAGAANVAATSSPTSTPTSNQSSDSIAAPSTSSTSATSSTHTTETTGTTTKTTNTNTTEATTVKVPQLKGLAVANALAELDDLGFTIITVTKEPSEAVDAGNVTRTNPVAGKSIEPGAHITVFESTGPEVVEVEVPDTIGLTQAAAEETLTDAGFGVVTESITLDEGSPDIGKVVEQSPSSGTTAATGTKITIVIGRKPLVLQPPVFVPDTEVAPVAEP